MMPLSVFAADCTYPKAPAAVPDGKTAAESEMVSAMSAFKQYNSDVTSYLACLEAETSEKIREAGGSTGAVIQIKSLQSKKHNAAVEELQKLAGRFNEQVRNFKSRK
jgi:3-keto-L-gulonate-6-phosphate decarboxylase